MQKLIKIFIASLITITFSCTTDDQNISDEVKENIIARVNNDVNTGIVVGVITPRGTSFFSYGVKSMETNEPVDEHTIFEIGSITKTFTGILLANEVVNGELSLDDQLQNLLPEGITAPTKNGESIKLVHLANHTSALPRAPNNFVRTNPENPYADLTEQQVYEFVNNYELPYDIGTKFLYSNLGMGLLGNVLAAKNNTTYEELMLEKIAEPLNLEDTRITLTSDMENRFAKGYNMGVEVDYYTLPAIAGAGAIRSTAVDMLKYLAANMGIKKTDLYPALELSHTSTGINEGEMTAGLGWITSMVEEEEIIWHDGGTGGFMSFIGFTKDGKKGVVVLTNSNGFPDDIGFHLLNPKSELKNPTPSIASKLNRIIENEGIVAALKSYAQLKKDNPDEYNFSSSELINLGYKLIQKDKINEALEIFRINVETYPDDWNANDSYAEALLRNNEKEKSIKYYKKSIQLNPENAAGITVLKELGVEIERYQK
ncbi:serine hydrolase [Maribellus sediminis]|uniref:serine hydrolase n=1 Tax=Maribellus sediminis TaxID=2696285 RepID=UPI001430D0AB|nr:serine hydrolase [Maribellus sediminis]